MGVEFGPRKFGPTLPEKYEFLEGKAEMLHLDTARNRVMLLGKVEVFDEKFKLTCDRLTVLLGSDKKNRDRSSMNFSGISAIYADGNVKMARRLPPGAPGSERREVHGDHMIYDVVKASKPMEPVRENWEQVLDTLRGQGAELFILGCTELPVLSGALRSKGPFLDPTDELAKEAILFCGYEVKDRFS